MLQIILNSFDTKDKQHQNPTPLICTFSHQIFKLIYMSERKLINFFFK